MVLYKYEFIIYLFVIIDMLSSYLVIKFNKNIIELNYFYNIFSKYLNIELSFILLFIIIIIYWYLIFFLIKNYQLNNYLYILVICLYIVVFINNIKEYIA